MELRALRSQARLDVAQAFPVGSLCECQTQRLLAAGEALDLVLAAIRRDAVAESRQRQMLGQRRKNQLACVHVQHLRKWSLQARTGVFSS
jgi:hypothetical protein